MRPHGKAFVEIPPSGPWAVCDRCSFLFNKNKLIPQFDYRGGQLVNTKLLVCQRCLDEPFILNKPLQISADPEPVLDARPETMIPVDD